MSEPKISINTWLDREFPNEKDGRPTDTSVRRWIDNKKIRGMKIGGRYFVFESWQPSTTGNPLADKLIQDMA